MIVDPEHSSVAIPSGTRIVSPLPDRGDPTVLDDDDAIRDRRLGGVGVDGAPDQRDTCLLGGCRGRIGKATDEDRQRQRGDADAGPRSHDASVAGNQLPPATSGEVQMPP